MNAFFPGHFIATIDEIKRIEWALAIRIVAAATDAIAADIDEDIRRLASMINLHRTPLEMVGAREEVDRRFSKLLVRINGYADDDGGRSNAAVRHELRVLRETIEHGIAKRHFFFMPETHAQFFDQSALFGELVAKKFPEANREITEAGNCYAIESYSACVFHLIRVVEIAARVMVAALGVGGLLQRPVKLCDWGKLLEGLQKGVNKKEVHSATSLQKKETFEFYNHAVSQFRNFKDAWRNNASHKRKSYKAREAKDIMDNVRQFMVHVAQRLKERKGETFE